MEQADPALDPALAPPADPALDPALAPPADPAAAAPADPNAVAPIPPAAPIDVANDPEVEELGDEGEEEGNKEELDVTDLVASQKNMEQKQEEYFDNLFAQLKTLEEKLEFLKIKHQDFILSLATSAKDWKSGKKIYHLIVINSDDLDYHNAVWEDTIGVRGGGKGKVVGHKCVGNGYTAKIQKSMSDQLWTDIDESLFKVIYEIVI